MKIIYYPNGYDLHQEVPSGEDGPVRCQFYVALRGTDGKPVPGSRLSANVDTPYRGWVDLVALKSANPAAAVFMCFTDAQAEKPSA